MVSAGERGLILLSPKTDELCESLIAIVGSQYDDCTFSKQDKAMKTPVDWHFRGCPKIVIFDISFYVSVASSHYPTTLSTLYGVLVL